MVLEETLQSPLDRKEINYEYSLERPTVRLKFQYFGHLMQRADSLEKTLILGKIEGGRRSGKQEGDMVGWHHRLNGHGLQQTPGDSKGQGSLAGCSPWGCKVSDITEQLSNRYLGEWTDSVSAPLLSYLRPHWFNQSQVSSHLNPPPLKFTYSKGSLMPSAPCHPLYDKTLLFCSLQSL